MATPDTNTSSESLQELLSRWGVGRVVVEVLSDPRRFWVMFLVGFLSLVVVAEMARGLKHKPHGDVQLYQRVAQKLWDGQLPYRDFRSNLHRRGHEGTVFPQ